jgi:hypothetical protein
VRCLVSSLAAAVMTLLFVASTPAQDNIESLLKRLDSKNANRRVDALKRLAALGPRAAPAIDRLVAVLTRFNDEERPLAVAALGAIGKAAIPALEKLLAHEDELMRHDAAWALGLMGPDAKAVVPRLLKLVQLDADDDARAKAIFALSRIDAEELATMRALVKISSDERAAFTVRIAVLEHLPRWGEPAISPLGEALRNRWTAFAADRALADLLAEHKTQSAADAMQLFILDAYAQAEARQSLLNERNTISSVRLTLSELCNGKGMSAVLSKAGSRLIDPLQRQLHGQNAASRNAACRYLAHISRTLYIHKDAPDLVEQIANLLVPFLRHDDRETRAAVADHLPATKTSRAALEEAQFDRDEKVGYAARLTLAGYGVNGEPRAFARLDNAKGPEQLRIAAGLLFSDRAIDVMRDALNQKDDAERRHQAAFHVGSRRGYMYVENKKQLIPLAIPVLLESLRGNDPFKRAQAAEGLAGIAAPLDAAQVAIVVAALVDNDKHLRRHAVAALSWQALAHARIVLPAVTPFLGDSDAATRLAAVSCFADCPATDVPMLAHMLAEEKEPAVRLSLVTTLARHAADPHAYGALLTAAEKDRETMKTLLRVAEKKCLPDILAILAKNDEAIRLTLAELPAPAATLSATLEAMATLLDREDLPVNRRAFRSLVQLSSLRTSPEASTWFDKAQNALVKRMPQLTKNLESDDVMVRCETVKLLRQVAAMPILPAESSVKELLARARRNSELTVRRIARKPISPFAGVYDLE